MDTSNFDTLARAAARAASRREAIRLLLTAVLGITAARPPAIEAGAPALCGAAGTRCRKHRQCCSGRCKKKRHKRRGRCTSLGPDAANCPKVEICAPVTAVACRFGGAVGQCQATTTGEVICAANFGCDNDEPICADDADCADKGFGATSRCVSCAHPGCVETACMLPTVSIG